jgi:hypothetical protein
LSHLINKTYKNCQFILKKYFSTILYIFEYYYILIKLVFNINWWYFYIFYKSMGILWTLAAVYGCSHLISAFSKEKVIFVSIYYLLPDCHFYTKLFLYVTWFYSDLLIPIIHLSEVIFQFGRWVFVNWVGNNTL